MIKTIGLILWGAFVAFMLARSAVATLRSHEPGRDFDHGNTYFLCVVFVFSCSVIVGGGLSIWSKSPALGSIINTFLVTLVPALLGIRVELGPRPRANRSGGSND
jgi:hypothetical protein